MVGVGFVGLTEPFPADLCGLGRVGDEVLDDLFVEPLNELEDRVHEALALAAGAPRLAHVCSVDEPEVSGTLVVVPQEGTRIFGDLVERGDNEGGRRVAELAGEPADPARGLLVRWGIDADQGRELLGSQVSNDLDLAGGVRDPQRPLQPAVGDEVVHAVGAAGSVRCCRERTCWTSWPMSAPISSEA